MPYYTRISFLAHRFLLCRTLSPARGRKWLLRPAPRLHGNLPRPLDRHGRAPCPRSARRIARESSSPARRLSPGYAKCQRAGKNDFYEPTVISRVHSTATIARTVPSLGASYCTRIFVSRASAFARLHAAANAPESAVGRKRAAPACGRKRLLRPAPCLHGNLPRPLDRHGCANRALARRITRIFVSRASAFARLCAAANAPESAVGRKRRRKRLLRPTSCLHGNLPQPLDRHGRAHRALARRITRIFVSRASAFARLRKVPACGQKRLLRPSR